MVTLPILKKRSHRVVFFILLSCIFITTISFSGLAEDSDNLNLPKPGTMVSLSPQFAPSALKGIQIYPDNPLKFDFIVDKGDSHLKEEALKEESRKLVKYFLAALTIPEEDLWVNLNPYEQDKITNHNLGLTEMGRDLLAQDYMLKQLTASLIYPEEDLGKAFWDRVYKKAYQMYGTTNIPVNTFNKVWIIPDKAVVYEKGDTALVVESRLKVMLEEDYLALNNNLKGRGLVRSQLQDDEVKKINDLSSTVVREIVLPEIEKEVNEGKNFALLRQIYNSLVLATWYKKNLKESLLGKIYIDKGKVAGVDVDDKAIKDKIYDQYVQAYKQGVYDYIREDYDAQLKKTVPRNYFSGGLNFEEMTEKFQPLSQMPLSERRIIKQRGDAGFLSKVSVDLHPAKALFQTFERPPVVAVVKVGGLDRRMIGGEGEAGEVADFQKTAPRIFQSPPFRDVTIAVAERNLPSGVQAVVLKPREIGQPIQAMFHPAVIQGKEIIDLARVKVIEGSSQEVRDKLKELIDQRQAPNFPEVTPINVNGRTIALVGPEARQPQMVENMKEIFRTIPEAASRVNIAAVSENMNPDRLHGLMVREAGTEPAFIVAGPVGRGEVPFNRNLVQETKGTREEITRQLAGFGIPRESLSFPETRLINVNVNGQPIKVLAAGGPEIRQPQVAERIGEVFRNPLTKGANTASIERMNLEKAQVVVVALQGEEAPKVIVAAQIALGEVKLSPEKIIKMEGTRDEIAKQLREVNIPGERLALPEIRQINVNGEKVVVGRQIQEPDVEQGVRKILERPVFQKVAVVSFARDLNLNVHAVIIDQVGQPLRLVIPEQVAQEIAQGRMDFDEKNIKWIGGNNAEEVEMKMTDLHRIERPEDQKVAGIDLNPQRLILQSTGMGTSRFNFQNINVDLDQLQKTGFDGFIPVIENLIPVQDFEAFLGGSPKLDTPTPQLTHQ